MDSASTFVKEKVIGKGSFGEASIVRSSIDNSRYVMKEISASHLSKKARLEALNEIRILSALQHPHIVQYRSSFLHNKKVCIIMDYCQGGDLSRRVKTQTSPFREEIILSWFTQICLGLKHVHDRKILHRDLKTQNIFLTADGEIKLGDFGIAKALNDTMQQANTYVGTPYYMAPEICESKPYDQAADIWSLGCILYELMTLRHPFEGRDMAALVRAIISGRFAPLPRHYSSSLRALVLQMLQVNPAQRPTINELLSCDELRRYAGKTMDRQSLLNEFEHTVLHNVDAIREAGRHDATVLHKQIVREDREEEMQRQLRAAARPLGAAKDVLMKCQRDLEAHPAFKPFMARPAAAAPVVAVPSAAAAADNADITCIRIKNPPGAPALAARALPSAPAPTPSAARPSTPQPMKPQQAVMRPASPYRKPLLIPATPRHAPQQQQQQVQQPSAAVVMARPSSAKPQPQVMVMRRELPVAAVYAAPLRRPSSAAAVRV
eukprot:TRINITY_DN3566_c0_g1_i1.p1 TRINITY_DN3566_c0_g1~~TRINITY_DN3566_c0_g1_i1.p1  ORF type:complete len:493 (-),score=151.02 TRINITY_DN3566_c0_g1_i1:20-1498(-)